MITVRDVGEFLGEFAPPRLAEDWDNVGLLVGDPERSVRRVMTCLTVTPATAEEAAQAQVDLIVSHHPLPFRPLKRLTTETLPGRLLLRLIGSGLAVYSPHTAFDSAASGINQRLAQALGLQDIQPLVAWDEDPDGLGAGRWGRLPQRSELRSVAERMKQFLSQDRIQVVGCPEQAAETIAVACGAAGQFLGAAHQAGCDTLVVGETSFHTCLEAEASGVGLVLPGHFASERFAVEALAEVLQERFAELDVWASRDESDPLRWI